MAFDLDAVEARVLGCLIEKDMATPEYYPLSANALVNACNQKSSREPVMAVTEHDVNIALDRLQHRGMTLRYTSARVIKFGHRLVERLQLGNRELAVLAVLLLRGPQTLGELRGRTQSLHNFEDLDLVESVLKKLSEREEPLTKPVGNRWAHLLSGDVTEFAPVAFTASPARSDDRYAALEARVAALEAELADFKRRFE
jgi:uncharacterized protein YceH (UPF0502 family)